MASVLESILQQHGQLKLVSVKSLPAQPLIRPDAEQPEPEKLAVGDSVIATVETVDSLAQAKPEPENSNVEVYRHGLQMEFEGNYLAALNYLKALEALQWEFYWDAVQLEVTKYPRSKIIITVHTLSLRDSWIGV